MNLVRRWSWCVAAASIVMSVASTAGAGASAEEPPVPTAVEIAVPAIEGLPAVTMAAELFVPGGAGPFPVVVYSHGRATKPADRNGLRSAIPRGHARYWMRKGFAVVAPVRPGYGATGGPDRERSGARLEPDGACGGALRVTSAGEVSATAVRAAVDWARRQPWALADRVLLVGTSAGGVATVVAASHAPLGVVGFVNFSGGVAGFPDKRPGASCGEAALAALFRRVGPGVAVPNLWLYAENDRYWGSEAPRRWHGAFAAGGSPTRFVMTGPVPNEDGHRLMLRGGRLWSVHVDDFVAGLGFAARPLSSPAPE
ncbi:MAG: hypothetical protein OEL76_04710 [Siculibacillus sp.]|nr:hypothetical protein [Siculibacillus sp.]